jgi:hypothetical protein
MQVGEADGEGIKFGMKLREKDADVCGVVPREKLWHGEFLKCKFSRFQSFKVSKPKRLPREASMLVFETVQP